MPQFFIKTKDIKGNFVELTQRQDIKHITNVLRLKIGSKILFIDENEILYNCKIEAHSKNSLQAKIITHNKSIRTLNTDITLIQSILKSTAQDLAIQKATELGVKKIIPVLSEYSVIKFKDTKDKTKKVERWQKIAEESCKQCERSKPPIIQNIMTLKEALELKFDIIIACVERSTQRTLKDILRNTECKKNQKIALLIGPEGGWADNEILGFEEKDIAKASLGNMILRAETAIVTGLSGIIYEYEN